MYRPSLSLHFNPANLRLPFKNVPFRLVKPTRMTQNDNAFPTFFLIHKSLLFIHLPILNSGWFSKLCSYLMNLGQELVILVIVYCLSNWKIDKVFPSWENSQKSTETSNTAKIPTLQSNCTKNETVKTWTLFSIKNIVFRCQFIFFLANYSLRFTEVWCSTRDVRAATPEWMLPGC